jgi:transcription-repair coupling factor (superfamily II helicase)
MLVPRPQPPGFGAEAPRDEELLDWARQVIDGVIAPDAPANVAKNVSEETGS